MSPLDKANHRYLRGPGRRRLRSGPSGQRNIKIDGAKVFSVYGKGGIGKSTTSSNLSCRLFEAGQAGSADRLRP